METSFDASAFRSKGPPVPLDGWIVLQILASNAVAIAASYREHWSMLMLILPFWFQSVAIGAFTWLRMLQLERFSTAGVAIDGRAVDASAQTRDRLANFFALHYGGFHLGYAVFIGMLAKDGKFPGAVANEPLQTLGMMAIVALFVGAQYREYARTVAADRARTPNIGAIDWLPYFRVVPMHLVIVGGAMYWSGDRALLTFGALKTAVDLITYLLGRRVDAGAG